MSDRFDITFDRTFDTKPDGEEPDDGAKPARRVQQITGEVIIGAGRHRQWSTDEKARILFESMVPGANVSAIARRYGINPQQLFGWRKEAREQWAAEERAKPSPQATAAFVPVMLTARSAAAPAAPAIPPAPPCSGQIEIVIGDCIVRVIGGVEAGTLMACEPACNFALDASR